ncbi:hypothetical protein CPter91_4888 [Collimonas pratensis]|uniref:Uncharacterized protein n=1 Tax=Collimonas pratensis TaxID=279113 RepID=A0A127QAZ7_9BURK|nr:hypothetical protein CPter91_4888 [Collimonas pratensis]
MCRAPLGNKLGIWAAVAGALLPLLRSPPLAVLALRRVGRLASHPAKAAQMPNLLPNGP